MSEINIRVGMGVSNVSNAKIGDKVLTTRLNENGEIESVEGTIISATNKTYTAEELLSFFEKNQPQKPSMSEKPFKNKVSGITELSENSKRVILELLKDGVVFFTYSPDLTNNAYLELKRVLGEDFVYLDQALDELDYLGLLSRNNPFTDERSARYQKITILHVEELLDGNYLAGISDDYDEFKDYYEREQKKTASDWLRIGEIMLRLERDGHFQERNMVMDYQHNIYLLLNASTPFSKKELLQEVLNNYLEIREIFKSLSNASDYQDIIDLYTFKQIRQWHKGTPDLFAAVIDRNQACPCQSGKKFKKCCL